MKTNVYKLPYTAYPSYENATRKSITFYKRFHKVLKTIGHEKQIDYYKLPKLEKTHVLVTYQSNTRIEANDVVEIKSNAKYKRSEHKSYTDVKSILKYNKLDETNRTIIVVELNEIPNDEEVALYEQNQLQIVIVAKNNNMMRNLHFKATKRDMIGKQIDRLLEINARTKCIELQRILGDIMRTGTTHIAKAVHMRATTGFRRMLKCCVAPNAFQMEQRPRIPELSKKQTKIRTTDSISTTKVYGILVEDAGNGAIETVELFEDNVVIYRILKEWSYQLHKEIIDCVNVEYSSLATAVQRQAAVKVKDAKLENNANTRSLLFGLLVSTIDDMVRVSIANTPLNRHDCPYDMLSVKLRQRSKAIEKGLYSIISDIKTVEILDHHTKLIRMESESCTSLLGELDDFVRSRRIILKFKTSSSVTTDTPKASTVQVQMKTAKPNGEEKIQICDTSNIASETFLFRPLNRSSGPVNNSRRVLYLVRKTIGERRQNEYYFVRNTSRSSEEEVTKRSTKEKNPNTSELATATEQLFQDIGRFAHSAGKTNVDTKESKYNDQSKIAPGSLAERVQPVSHITTESVNKGQISTRTSDEERFSATTETKHVNESGATPKKLQRISQHSALEVHVVNTTPKELSESNSESTINKRTPIEETELIKSKESTSAALCQECGCKSNCKQREQEKTNVTTALLNETPIPGLPSKLAVLATNGEMVYVTTKPEEDLPQQWPNEEVMKEPIQVKCCVLKSEFVKDNWLDPKVYSLKKGCRGKCLIVSNKTFTGPLEADENGVPKVALATRHGTERDLQGLKELFTQLYFHVVTHEDLTAAKLNEIILQESLNRKSEDECFVCIICSHGNNKGIYGTDGEIVQVDDITACFDGQNCTALIDKPKLFFIQACRGGESDNPVPIQRVNKSGIATSPMPNDVDALPTAPSNETPLLKPDTSIPNKADTLIACATHPGYVSFRNKVYGSWFLQAVIHVFQKYAWKESVLDMLIYVNELVARGRTPDADGGRPLRQAAVSTNSFRRKFYFFPGIVEPNGTSS